MKKFIYFFFFPFVYTVGHNLRGKNDTMKIHNLVDVCNLNVFRSLCLEHDECYWDKDEYVCKQILSKCFDRKSRRDCHEDENCDWNTSLRICRWKHHCHQYDERHECIDDDQCQWKGESCEYST